MCNKCGDCLLDLEDQGTKRRCRAPLSIFKDGDKCAFFFATNEAADERANSTADEVRLQTEWRKGKVLFFPADESK